MTEVQLLVVAKAPRAGRSKTRLCPPCTPEEAAWLAEAALADTLAAVAATPVRRRVLVLSGELGPWLPGGFEVLAQRGDGFDEPLAAAFVDAGTPALLVGMDTPQVTRTSSPRRWRRWSGRALTPPWGWRPTEAGGRSGCVPCSATESPTLSSEATMPACSNPPAASYIEDGGTDRRRWNCWRWGRSDVESPPPWVRARPQPPGLGMSR